MEELINEIGEKEVDVAEPQDIIEPISEKDLEVAEPNIVDDTLNNNQDNNSNRNYEKDNAYATMRKTLEKSQREIVEAKQEKERLINALKMFGFDGSSSDDILDQANAHYYNKDIEEVRKERLEEAQKIAEENEVKNRLAYYEQKELEEKMKNDLKEIQKLNPSITSWEQMPNEYFELLGKGIDGTKVYKLLEIDGFFQNAKQIAEQEAVKKIQANSKASVGSANQGKVTEKVTYANMSDAEFDKLIEKVKRGEI